MLILDLGIAALSFKIDYHDIDSELTLTTGSSI